MKKFFEANFTKNYPVVNQVISPYCPSGYEYKRIFLVYAENEKDAFALAYQHIYDGKLLEKFYGTYNCEKYNGEVRCIMS